MRRLDPVFVKRAAVSVYSQPPAVVVLLLFNI